MKKIIALLLSSIIIILCFTSCRELPEGSSSVLSSESEVADVSSSEVSEPESVEAEEAVVASSEEQTTSSEVSSEAVSSEAVEPTPTVSQEATASTVTPTTSTPTDTTSNTDYTTPSAAALEYSGITYEEFQTKMEEASTCVGGCGRSSKVCHFYGRDMNCYDCGAPCKANTCHVCGEE